MNRDFRRRMPGMTLMECVLACAMMAVALPSVMLVMAHSRGSARDAEMEVEAQRAVLQHGVDLLRANSAMASERIAWAHGVSGECFGSIDEEDYRRGVSRHRGEIARYLVVAEREGSTPADAAQPLQTLSLRLEHPAAAPASHRSRVELHAEIRP